MSMTTPRVTVPVEPTEAMRLVPDRVLTETLYWMARAYERVHSMPRVSDTELANKIEAAKADLGRARDASPVLSNSAAPAPEGGEVPDDVRRLVIAAREVAYGERHRHGEDIAALDKAAEAFADRVEWDDEPTSAEMFGPIFFTDKGAEDRYVAGEEAPAEAGERDKRAWIDRWNAIEEAARDALHTMNELLEAPNLKRMQYALGERRDALTIALNLPEAGTAWMRPAREGALPLGCFCDEADCSSCSSINPAPSSLAGGEVTDAAVERAAQALVDYFWDGSQPAFDRKSAKWKKHHVGAVRAVLAALSPEAPARVGEVMAATDVPMWADGIATDGENVAMAQKAEADHGGHYWAVDGGNGGLDWEPTHFISLNALTPRHEAPAALCDQGHTDPMALCSDCEAASVEAPAEGAGESLMLVGNQFGTGLSEPRLVRARSSAPEAREEPVAWRYKAKFSDLAHSHWHYTDRDPSAAKTITNVQPLYAAPSADKLRAAEEALEAIKEVSGDRAASGYNETGRLARINERCDQALAALQAEQGAK